VSVDSGLPGREQARAQLLVRIGVKHQEGPKYRAVPDRIGLRRHILFGDQVAPAQEFAPEAGLSKPP